MKVSIKAILIVFKMILAEFKVIFKTLKMKEREKKNKSRIYTMERRLVLDLVMVRAKVLVMRVINLVKKHKLGKR